MSLTEILSAAPGFAWWALPVLVLAVGIVFGLAPGLLLWAVVQLYPKGHPRREEMFGELHAPEMGRIEKYEWVFMQLETALRQGLPLRLRARAQRRARHLLDVPEEDLDPSSVEYVRRVRHVHAQAARSHLQYDQFLTNDGRYGAMVVCDSEIIAIGEGVIVSPGSFQIDLDEGSSCRISRSEEMVEVNMTPTGQMANVTASLVKIGTGSLHVRRRVIN